MNAPLLRAAARYVERNPVRARLVACAEDWPWSSARAHLRREPDGLTEIETLLAIVPNWSTFLATDVLERQANALRSAERTGRPLESAAFLQEVDAELGRRLRPQKPGRRTRPG